ncbi:nicotianamine synthase family protein [Candidatus Methanocrinis natronophilus]|uniref:Nicotianamine synthase family protein n=1 Tax=Candidatus Methanocrinis natronophilus TaxID=3033396 RepID=A0ABT5X500_9EURY|nr:nicotianamine synthase family protein [Candidatus Methanocrinis natronophilus]MDF0589766.1 nicotianamine synthase family protein [Candidatus Methanocrinis natronophilus]
MNEMDEYRVPEQGSSICRIARLTKTIEDMGSRWPRLALIYSEWLYGDVVDKELALADLRVGSSILHVGCGSLPFTALLLAKKGFIVTAVDNDPVAVDAAQRFVDYYETDADITIQIAEGASLDASSYDAVWVSLNVAPKEMVLFSLLDSMRSGAKLIYRNPQEKRMLGSLYRRVLPGHIGHDAGHKTLPTDGVKEAVLIKKGCSSIEVSQPTATSTGGYVLDDLAADQTARVMQVPDYPVIPPLGIRPGKLVTVQCRHPFGGPLVLEVEGRRVALAREFAREILVA